MPMTNMRPSVSTCTTARNTLRIYTVYDFSITYDAALPELGKASQELRILSQEWSFDRDRLTLHLSGMPNHRYELNVSDPAQVSSVEGGTLVGSDSSDKKIQVLFPDGPSSTPVNQSLIVHLVPRHGGETKSKR